MIRLLQLICHFFIFRLKAKLEYRVNFFIENLHSPFYIGVLFVLIKITYLNAPILGGFTSNEAMLMFFIFNLIFSFCWIFFLEGIRRFLWKGVSQGELDTFLTKPIGSQFMVAFSQINTSGLLYFFGVTILFVRQVILMKDQLLAINLFFLTIFMILSIMIMYFLMICYASIALYVTRAQQAFELFNKLSDLAQYPLPIFPKSLQLILSTVVPVIFFSYYPTLIALGRGSFTKYFTFAMLFLLSIFFISQFLWKKGLKRYSSASS